MTMTRKPAVAGLFYPDLAIELQDTIQKHLSHVQKTYPLPKAMIVPHAGYIYSGPVAASAYACLQQNQNVIQRVVLLGPAHRYPVLGIASPQSDVFETPLGKITVDHKSIDQLSVFPAVEKSEEAHHDEHSLEVQLPFLQVLLHDFTLIPLIVGQSNAQCVAQVLEALWGGSETLIIISSDLSHYHDYQTAQKIDRQTAEAILQLDSSEMTPKRACGSTAMSGLLRIALQKGLTPQLIDLRNSGDTAGPKTQVVGYSAFHFI